jgi:hypothetical protein
VRAVHAKNGGHGPPYMTISLRAGVSPADDAGCPLGQLRQGEKAKRIPPLVF